MWFRRDLRLADNPALVDAAAGHDRVVPLFVHDDRLLAPSGSNRVAYLHATLDALDRSIGGALVERLGDPASVVLAAAREVGADDVYAAADHGPYGVRRDLAVEDALRADGRRLHLVGSPYAVDPGVILTKGGTPYRVFTPFSRAWRAQGWPDPLAAPDLRDRLLAIDGDPRPTTPTPTATAGLPEAGEDAAHAALDRFLAEHLDRYDEHRDRPDLDATSRLSPHLKVGSIHPRQLLAELANAGRGGSGAGRFETEVCWRDFYADVLHHRPESARRDLTDALGTLEWDEGPEADERFEAWSAGRTGYPIVDAGMRQLLAEGWMHNRVRMIVASFLVKDLHLHWRRGAAWFMHHLVDGDLASNQHGWQWVAGTGTDASPFFRVFNPTSQGRRFDPSGDYVRRYVPELGSVLGPDVHEPRAGGAGRGADAPGLFDDPEVGTAYPAPMVDHADERREALDRYGRART
jgi:deoxyribodipyrimidine photo-lyase